MLTFIIAFAMFMPATVSAAETVNIKLQPVASPVYIDRDSTGTYYLNYDVVVENATNVYMLIFRLQYDKSKLEYVTTKALNDKLFTVGSYLSKMFTYPEGTATNSVLLASKPSNPLDSNTASTVARVTFKLLDKSAEEVSVLLFGSFAKDKTNTTVAAVSNGGESQTAVTQLTGSQSGAKTVRANIESGTSVLVGTVLEAYPVTEPADAAAKGEVISWSSSNKNIAKVSPAGIITTFNVGPATITLKFRDELGAEFTHSFVLNVTAPEPTSLKISGPALSSLAKGKTLQLNAIVTPERALEDPNATLVWTSSNPAVAQVDPVTGLVTAKTAGTVIITCTLTTPTKTLKATTAVKVTN